MDEQQQRQTDESGHDTANVGRDGEEMGHSRGVKQLVLHFLLRDNHSGVVAAHANARKPACRNRLEGILCDVSN